MKILIKEPKNPYPKERRFGAQREAYQAALDELVDVDLDEMVRGWLDSKPSAIICAGKEIADQIVVDRMLDEWNKSFTQYLKEQLEVKH
ncbi:MAG: hypothetical protein H8E40_07535 [Chloroflexi bacterium]|nr:hypothetical protein [Chloroflexota bacterium]